MAIKMTLDSIRESVRKKFDSFDIEFGSDVLRLRNPLALPEKVRARMFEIVDTLDTFDTSDEDTSDENVNLEGFREAVRELVLTTAANRHVAEKFLAEIAVDVDDEEAEDFEIHILIDVFGAYMSDQQVGEA